MKRTTDQNSALHLYFRMLADMLNLHGHYMNRMLGGTNSDDMMNLACKLFDALDGMESSGIVDDNNMDKISEVGKRLKIISHKLKVEIPWTETAVKEGIWKPIQMALYNKVSTTELTTAEVNQVYEAVEDALASRLSPWEPVPFPSEESMSEEQRFEEKEKHS